MDVVSKDLRKQKQIDLLYRFRGEGGRGGEHFNQNNYPKITIQ